MRASRIRRKPEARQELPDVFAGIELFVVGAQQPFEVGFASGPLVAAIGDTAPAHRIAGGTFVAGLAQQMVGVVDSSGGERALIAIADEGHHLPFREPDGNPDGIVVQRTTHYLVATDGSRGG